MDMDKDKLDEDALEALFSAAQATTPQPSSEFMARLSVDAARAAPAARALASPSPTPTLFSRFKGLFAASGLSGAAALGVWIGFVMPEIVTTVSPLSEDAAGLTVFLPGADLSVLSE